MARKVLSADEKKARAADRREKDKAKRESNAAQKKADDAAKAMKALEEKEEKARKKAEKAQKAADAKAAADRRKAEAERENARRLAELFEIEKAKYDKYRAEFDTAQARKRAIARGEKPAAKPRRMPKMTADGGVKTAVRIRRNPDKGYKRRAYVSTRGKLDDGDNRVAYPGENKRHPRDVYVSDRGNFFRVYGEQGE